MNELLVVYYSRTGTARQVAQQLARMAQGHIGEVVDPVPRIGFWGDLRCVFDSLLRRTPRMRYSGPIPSRYRSVVLVAPVWMRHLAAPMRSFVLNGPQLPRRVGVVCVMAREGAFQAVQEVADATRSTPVATLVLQQQKVLDGSAGAEMERFLEDFSVAGRATRPMRPVELSPRAS
nr:hypothetical protein [uncultured Caldimonas sp.]